MGHLLTHLRQSALLKLAVKAGLTLLAFWFVFRGIDFAMLGDMLRRQDHGLLAVAVLFLALQIAVGSLRWRLILNALSETGKSLLGHKAALIIYYISIFFMCCLPGTVGGDVMRVWLTKSEHVPMTTAIHSVIIDRIIALVALGSMIMVALPSLASIAGFDAFGVFAIVAALAAAGVLILVNLERIIGRYRRFRLVHWVLYFLDSLRLILKRRVASAQSFLLAVSTHSFYCIGAYFLAQSFHIPISLIQCMILIPPVVLATTLPITVGGWGIREAGMIAMFRLAGVSQAAALMLSIQLGVIVIAITLPAGILWLFYRKRAA